MTYTHLINIERENVDETEMKVRGFAEETETFRKQNPELEVFIGYQRFV